MSSCRSAAAETRAPAAKASSRMAIFSSTVQERLGHACYDLHTLRRTSSTTCRRTTHFRFDIACCSPIVKIDGIALIKRRNTRRPTEHAYQAFRQKLNTSYAMSAADVTKADFDGRVFNFVIVYFIFVFATRFLYVNPSGVPPLEEVWRYSCRVSALRLRYRRNHDIFNHIVANRPVWSRRCDHAEFDLISFIPCVLRYAICLRIVENSLRPLVWARAQSCHDSGDADSRKSLPC